MLQGAALAGLVGDQALPFMEYREALNLPDPEDILKDPRRFVLRSPARSSTTTRRRGGKRR